MREDMVWNYSQKIKRTRVEKNMLEEEKKKPQEAIVTIVQFRMLVYWLTIELSLHEKNNHKNSWSNIYIL